jgi:hypothetical protein
MWRKATVTLDGVLVTDACQIADEEEGYVQVLERDEHGRFFRRGDDAAVKILKGKVHIRCNL